MRLTAFRVTDFRSVEDSGRITIDRVSAFIGVNESGKTNLLLPLWKLNPAQEGEIQPTSDYPKKLFGTIREEPEAYKFITAEFDIGKLAQTIAPMAGQPANLLERAIVSRYYDGAYCVEFPDCPVPRTVATQTFLADLKQTLTAIGNATPLQKEEQLSATFKEVLSKQIAALTGETLSPTTIKAVHTYLGKYVPAEPAKTSVIVPIFSQLLEKILETHAGLTKTAPGELEAVRDAVVTALPKFVYYSNYGNLDSEIYLPHVVQNLKRTDLGAKEAAKARTLKVLFRFVRLSPQEILELGKDFDDRASGRQPTAAEIEEIAEKKRERSILLQSASTLLTQKFREWWKQGDYRFRFEADGDHFRIWVADDRRPEEIELESRSTGLQWFLSFYLVFLVESGDEHKNSILLLDEPGLSLHPLAQRDLSAFFDNLAKTNQIAYTTHSPFLVDADRLDRARKVYVAADGTTKATENLREEPNAGQQTGAAYAVHSALNLTVAESLLLGCRPIVVEGPSDQHYLTAIKSLLIGESKISPTRELVFPPSGGAKTARMVASMITGRDEVLPYILLDDDVMGRKAAADLRTSLYQGEPDRLLNVADFVGYEGAEIEDLFPASVIADAVDRTYRVSEPEDEFALVANGSAPIVPQIEAWAGKRSISLPLGWKVEMAKRVKQQLLAKGLSAIPDATVKKWIKLFESFAP